MSNNSLILARRNLQTILQALAAASTHSTTAESEYRTLKRFVESCPEQQVFELVVRKENKKHHA